MKSSEDFARNDLPVLYVDGVTITDINYSRFEILQNRAVERREDGGVVTLIPGITTTQIIFYGCNDCPAYYEGKQARVYYRGRTYDGKLVYVSKNLMTETCEVCFVGGEGATR